MTIPINKSFCARAFTHQHIDNDGSAKLCCVARLNVTHDFNSPEYKKIRKNMLEGKRIAECLVCYFREHNNEISSRISINKYSENIPEYNTALLTAIDDFNHDKDIEPIDYDLRIRNLCNLTCIMCGPDASSAWAQKLNIEDKHKFNDFNDYKLNENTLRVYLAGGEPFLIKDYGYFLPKIKNKDCEIVINTNLTIWNQKFINLLKDFNDVTFRLSIDGIEDVGERIRVGMNWNKFCKI